jgi:hypothetical protein
MAMQVDNRISHLMPGMMLALQESMTSNEPLNVSIHRGFECDGCKMKPIVGVRHNCKACNFDLCTKCVKTVAHAHPMEKIEAPIPRMMKNKVVENKNKVHPVPTPIVESTPAGEVEVVKTNCPVWIEKKAQKVIEMFGTNKEKTEAYMTANKFLSIEEIIEKLLENEAELVKLQ